MNYRDPERLDALAAEYVLGTLRGAALARFERILRESEEAREAVTRWEQLLGGFGRLLPPETPPARVWQRIDSRIGGSSPSDGWWRSVRLWRYWALGATAALVASLTTMVSLRPTDSVPVGQVAIIQNQDDQPMWVISADATSGNVRARALNAEAAAVDQAYELWVLPADGPPRSLGLLPVNGGIARHDFPPALLALLANAQGLAISLEPAGGSPTGQPTGPVLYQAPIVDI